MRVHPLLVALLACAPAPALADTSELSLTAFGEYREGGVLTPDGKTTEDTAIGGGVQASLGLSFNLSLYSRYGLDFADGSQQSTLDLVERWSQRRHTVAVGLRYAYLDELTPVLSLEGGAVLAELLDRHVERAPQAELLERQSDRYLFRPLGRGGLGMSWSPTDTVALCLMGFGEYTAGLAWGTQLSLTVSQYLN